MLHSKEQHRESSGEEIQRGGLGKTAFSLGFKHGEYSSPGVFGNMAEKEEACINYWNKEQQKTRTQTHEYSVSSM